LGSGHGIGVKSLMVIRCIVLLDKKQTITK
jgi:hypothetical protein